MHKKCTFSGNSFKVAVSCCKLKKLRRIKKVAENRKRREKSKKSRFFAIYRDRDFPMSLFIMNRRCGRRTAYAQLTLVNKSVFNYFLKQPVVSIFLMLSSSMFHIPSDVQVKDLTAKADSSPLGLAYN